uniref:Stabilin 1 n=1 Tax=Gouania willdenowi TaxID=441366 RepID=A0A8C5D509_GOUWI
MSGRVYRRDTDFVLSLMLLCKHETECGGGAFASTYINCRKYIYSTARRMLKCSPSWACLFTCQSQQRASWRRGFSSSVPSKFVIKVEMCHQIVARCLGSPCTCPTWSGKTCNFKGTCLDGDKGNGTCICEEGFGGFACQECRNDNTFGENCDKECDCVHGSCNKGPEGDGQCLCQPPYTGRRCDQVSSRCTNCSPYSYCKGEGDSAYCECLPGYRKTPKNKCVCSQKDCDVNAACTSQGSKITCTCKADYEGDGRACVPKNPCTVNNGGCPINSTVCIFKGPNKSSCQCMFGMSAIGGAPELGCQLVSACREDTCDPSAACETGLDGQPRCTCKASQIGDGRRCYGNLMSRIVDLNIAGEHSGKLTGNLLLFGNGCLRLLSHNGPFTAFIPLLETPLTESVCKNHLILGQHLYKDLEGRDFNLYGGFRLRTKENKRFILIENPSRVYTVIKEDLPAANGVIHIIDKPITYTVLDRTTRDEQFSDKTIAEILTKDERYNRFLSLMDNCGSPPPLRGSGPLTVFVPTNEAIDKARDGSILYMLNDAKHKLQELLRHHVYSKAVGNVLLGEKGAHLTITNIMASNGIIHMIDGLLYPPSILPILPHRCDVVDNKITVGPCVHCTFLYETQCPKGTIEMVRFIKIQNHSVAECCPGFYGPDCKPCIGGFQHPCYDKGKCFDGINGNGSCSCNPGLTGVACHICADPSKHGENCDEDCRCVHGVCDNRPGSKGVCRRGSCLEEYSGEYCDKKATVCNADGLLEHCHMHAYCTQCVCRDGYDGDGHSCSPINPCLKSNRGGCDTNAECVYVGPGSVSCVCSEGWTGDGKVCVEINNCQLGTRGGCSVNANCNHIGPGQSECVCKTGFMGNGVLCDLVNPCYTNNGDCHFLVRIPSFKENGSRICTCPDGFSGNGETCYGSILDVNIHNFTINCEHFLITVQSQSFLPDVHRAHILDGVYSVEDLDRLVGTKLPSLHPQTKWEITNSSGVTTTTMFTTVVHNLLCIDLDFKKCVFFLQIHNLSEYLEKSDFTLLLPTDEAVRQHFKETNTTTLDADVLKYHLILRELLYPDHISDGTLKSTLLGDDYQVQFHLNEKNQTVVNDVLIDGTFHVTEYGVLILVPQVLKVRRNRCGKEISLQVNVRTERRERLISNKWREGWMVNFPSNMKSNCRYRKRVGSRRKSVPGCVIKCLQHTKDHSCCPGYYGHECFKCPGEVGNWCSNHGECQDGNYGNGECRCYEGFHGTACEDCEPGRYGVNCSSKCVCNHGKCEDGLTGSGKCVCYKGWKGTSCSIEIKDDSCGGACDENANCITGPKGSAAACLCVAGYEGNGTYCKELDLCSRSNGGCAEFATCKRVSAGERTCTCKQGYTGDGIVCLEFDGCLVNNGGCHEDAECIRAGPNIVRNSMFLGLIPNNGDCSKYARCVYLGKGQRNCTCNRGYMGDGIQCRGSTNTVRHETPNDSQTAGSDISGFFGTGPFTVFSPMEDSDSAVSQNGRLNDLLKNHIVTCEALTLSDLKTTKRVISLSGYELHFSLQQGSVVINNSSIIVMSDYTTTNGIIHHIDKLLMPYRLQDKGNLSTAVGFLNFTAAAAYYGYTRFYKLVEDAGLLPVLSMRIHQPFTVFWPTNKALDSLPPERWRWLTSPDHREQLVATVKAHIVRNSKVGGQQTSTFRTMHGSTIKYSCDKTLGAVMLNDDAATLVERSMYFKGGVAHGIDQLLEPPGLGAYCDDFENKTSHGRCGRCPLTPRCPFKHVDSPCFNIRSRYGAGLGRWSSDLDDHFSGMGCKRVCQYAAWTQKCCKNHYGRDCQVCPGGVEAPCDLHGNCDDGIRGSGVCDCHKGFRGSACELCAKGFYGLNCTACSCEEGQCDDGKEGSGQCVCNQGWGGDRCHINIAPDLCADYNGGCDQNAVCNQTGSTVNCTCLLEYQGDGYACQPINRCVEEANGGCSDFAECQFTGPNERACECLPGYVGNGVQCLEKVVPPVDRCLEDNGGCDPVASCKDLHYHANTAGVFHLRSPDGKYKMNFSQADAACQAEGATLASFKQLGDAQQLGMHLCVAGWMEGGKVGYPTRFPSVRCGDNHVGLVIYRDPVDQSSTYDAYCYRVKDVSCSCPAEYVGNGDFCNGVLTSVLATYSNFSIFYKLLLNYSTSSLTGKQFIDVLSDRKSVFTLFVPHNAGFGRNQTLSARDLQYHVTTNNCRRPFKALEHKEGIKSWLGFNLTVTHDDAESRKLVNKRLLVEWDIPAVNGIIHVIEAPLLAPPPLVNPPRGAASAILVSLFLACVLAALGYYVFKHKTDAFRFHYFRNEDEDGATSGSSKPTLVSIPNPLYSGSRAYSEPFGVSPH